MDPNNKYTKMQQEYYDSDAGRWSLTNRDPVVGTFDEHNAWQDYNDFMFKNIDTNGKMALDFGCGPGRNIVKFANRFQSIDGVDISQVNLDNAKLWVTQNSLSFTPTLYKNDGTDLSIIPSEKYDVVFSTICMQHICVYDIRYSLLTEMFRVLKPGGHLSIQMGFGNIHPLGVKYFDNYLDAQATNGHQDVMVENTDDVKADLEKIGFSNFEFDLRSTGPGDNRHSNWIYFRAQK